VHAEHPTSIPGVSHRCSAWAAEAIAIVATGAVYGCSVVVRTVVVSAIAKPLVGAIATYFVFNTGLVAGAIRWSTGSIGVARVVRRLSVERRQLHGGRTAGAIRRRRDSTAVEQLRAVLTLRAVISRIASYQNLHQPSRAARAREGGARERREANRLKINSWRS